MTEDYIKQLQKCAEFVRRMIPEGKRVNYELLEAGLSVDFPKASREGRARLLLPTILLETARAVS